MSVSVGAPTGRSSQPAGAGTDRGGSGPSRGEPSGSGPGGDEPSTASAPAASTEPHPPEPRPLYLDDGSGRPVFAVLHGARGERSGCAVLLCPPFGWEDMCCYRIRREWAERLAGEGHTTLRIDLPGSGDSAGAPGDPEQLRAWTQAVDAAVRWLDALDRPGGVAAVGIGLGGLVACRAALLGAPIDRLALWSTPARGAVQLRELRAFSRLERARVPAPADADAGTPDAGTPAHAGDDGGLAVNGYVLSAETVAALDQLDLARLNAVRAPRRALVLERDGLKSDGRLAAILEAAGAEVTIEDGPGWSAMMVEPQDAQPPTAVFDAVSRWLHARESRAPAGAPSRPTMAAPRAAEAMTFEHAGVRLRERPVFIDTPAARLFGVLCEPLGGRRELTGLLLNAGPQRRTGPNRMWVEIARRWASRGVSTLRLDAAGIGDSDGDPSVLARVTEFYRPTYVDQTLAALDALGDMGLPQRFVVGGLCSGAYWSAHAALADERVSALVMLNPRTLVFDEWRHARRRLRQLRERALQAATWRKLLRGEIKLARHLETGRTVFERAAGAPARLRARLAQRGGGTAAGEPLRDPKGARHGGSVTRRRHAAAAPRSVPELLDALTERGTRALLLFTGAEVLHRELDAVGALDDPGRWPQLELVLPDSEVETHTLSPPWLQRRVHALVDRLLDGELERLR